MPPNLVLARIGGPSDDVRFGGTMSPNPVTSEHPAIGRRILTHLIGLCAAALDSTEESIGRAANAHPARVQHRRVDPRRLDARLIVQRLS